MTLRSRTHLVREKSFTMYNPANNGITTILRHNNHSNNGMATMHSAAAGNGRTDWSGQVATGLNGRLWRYRQTELTSLVDRPTDLRASWLPPPPCAPPPPSPPPPNSHTLTHSSPVYPLWVSGQVRDSVDSSTATLPPTVMYINSMLNSGHQCFHSYRPESYNLSVVQVQLFQQELKIYLYFRWN